MVGAMIAEARSYLWEHGRILEQRRFDYLFGDGPAEAVIAAVLAYRNTDGGFGHALEPDGRGPLSQPLHTYTAILRLDEVGDHTQMAAAADYLQSVASADGGVSVGVAAAASHPHAPWWSTSGEPDLLATALTVSIFLKVGLLDHPWVSAATAYCWTALDAMQDTHPYEAIAAARFLDYVPDRERAVPASERLGALVRAKRLVDLSDSSDSAPTEARGIRPARLTDPTTSPRARTVWPGPGSRRWSWTRVWRTLPLNRQPMAGGRSAGRPGPR